MMRDLIQQLREAKGTGREKLMADAEKAGFTVETGETSGVVKIYKKHKGWGGKPSAGIELYPDNRAFDLTVPLDHQKVLRSFKVMRKVLGLSEGKELDPFKDLDKRTRLALRQALKDPEHSGAAPTNIVKKLEKRKLVARTGHTYEPQEWGKVVKRWPEFVLTDEGVKVAKQIVAKLGVK